MIVKDGADYLAALVRNAALIQHAQLAAAGAAEGGALASGRKGNNDGGRTAESVAGGT